MAESGLGSSCSPWIAIWTKPRATIQQIIQTNPNRGIWVLAFIYGFSSLLNFFQSMSLGLYFGLLTLYLTAAILAPFWGYLVFSVFSFAIHQFGRLFKGNGTFLQVRAAYSWSCVPLVFSALTWILVGAIFGAQVFLNYTEAHLFSDAQVLILFGILLIKILFGIWSLVIYLNALAQVEGFTVLRAIGTTVSAALAIAVALLFIQFLILQIGNVG